MPKDYTPEEIEARQVKRREASRRWYSKNKQKQLDANMRRIKKLSEWFRQYKATLQCAQCGENHPACLDFHHNDPKEKENAVYWGVHHARWGRQKIMAEIAKCTVLCANCHRKLHWDWANSAKILEIVD